MSAQVAQVSIPKGIEVRDIMHKSRLLCDIHYFFVHYLSSSSVQSNYFTDGHRAGMTVGASRTFSKVMLGFNSLKAISLFHFQQHRSEGFPARDIWFLGVILPGLDQIPRFLGTSPPPSPPSVGPKWSKYEQK